MLEGEELFCFCTPSLSIISCTLTKIQIGILGMGPITFFHFYLFHISYILLFSFVFSKIIKRVENLFISPPLYFNRNTKARKQEYFSPFTIDQPIYRILFLNAGKQIMPDLHSASFVTGANFNQYILFIKAKEQKHSGYLHISVLIATMTTTFKVHSLVLFGISF